MAHCGSDKEFSNTLLDFYRKRGDKSRHSPYRHKIVSAGNLDYFIMIWPPASYTPLHDHEGAVVTIEVLSGVLYREAWAKWEEGMECMESPKYHAGDVIIEDDDGVHKVGNASPEEWAASFHKFWQPPGEQYKMRIYDRGTTLVDGNHDVVFYYEVVHYE